MKFGLGDDIIKQINSVFEKHPQVDKVLLYGSRAKGTQRAGSDIDLTLKGEGLDLRLLCQLGTELDDLLTPYLFDISNFSDIENKDLIEHIGRVGKVFYER